MSDHEALRNLAEQQHGVISRRQLSRDRVHTPVPRPCRRDRSPRPSQRARPPRPWQRTHPPPTSHGRRARRPVRRDRAPVRGRTLADPRLRARAVACPRLSPAASRWHPPRDRPQHHPMGTGRRDDDARHPGHDPATDARRPGSEDPPGTPLPDVRPNARHRATPARTPPGARSDAAGTQPGRWRRGAPATDRRASARSSTGSEQPRAEVRDDPRRTPATHPSNDRSTSATTTDGSVGSTSSTATPRWWSRSRATCSTRASSTGRGMNGGSPGSDGQVGSSSRSPSTRSGTARISCWRRFGARGSRTGHRGSPRQA